MIAQIKTALSPALASFGVLAYWKGWNNKAVSFIDKAEKWTPEIKDFEGGYYEVYRLLSLYRLKPESTALRDELMKSIKRLKEYVPDDFEMIESIDTLHNHAVEEINENATKT